MQSDEDLARLINQAMDGWDTKPTPEERARIAEKYVAEQRAWLAKIDSLPEDEQAHVASRDADAVQAQLAEMKRGLIRAEAARLHVAQLKSQGEMIHKRAEDRILKRLTPTMSSEEMDKIAQEEADTAQAELLSWAKANPVPTVADDERAIDELIG
jgi:hypothetical protein